MLFNSLEFLVFFPIVTIAYFLCPFKFRWLLILTASYYFYASWNLAYLSIIMLSTTIDYVSAQMISHASRSIVRRFWLFTSILSNLGILFFFKYYGFFTASLANTCSFFERDCQLPTFHFLLPVGISFYTFQSLAYTVDVYRNKIKVENHPGLFALYVAFYPQLVAGPIERASHLLHQFRKRTNFEYDRVSSGLKLMFWGMFKKVVIADRLALVVDRIYGSPQEYSALPLAMATIFFAYQIYCDFSGYSDIAIGAARVMGIDLMKNFNSPYRARTIQDFWRRWHISLSTWFRDYLYIPLGGSKVSLPKRYSNLFVTFLVSGLWHGASWTFVIWGGLHGLYMIASHISKPIRKHLCQILGLSRRSRVLILLQVCTTFLLVNIAWIFFRANNVSDAIYIIQSISANLLSELMRSNLSFLIQEDLGISHLEFSFIVTLIIFLESIDYAKEHLHIIDSIRARPSWQRWALYYAGIAFVFQIAIFGKDEFIYFQF